MWSYRVDTACAKNVLNGQWYNFDDSSVSSITEESVVVSTAHSPISNSFPFTLLYIVKLSWTEIFLGPVFPQQINLPLI